MEQSIAEMQSQAEKLYSQVLMPKEESPQPDTGLQNTLPSKQLYEAEMKTKPHRDKDGTCGMCTKFERYSMHSKIAPCQWDYQLRNCNVPACDRYQQRKRGQWEPTQ